MTLDLTPPAVARMPRPVGFAVKVCKRGPPSLLRIWRKRVLRAHWRRGSAAPTRTSAESSDPAIVETGRLLRAQVLDANDRKHAPAGYRVLMLRERSVTAEIWFGDLERCMRHAGIECLMLTPCTPVRDIAAAFETFRPNVFIATELIATLRTLDLQFIQRYKRENGCLRLFIPVWHSKAPGAHVPPGRSTPAEDEWRRRLRRNELLADAHFSIFEPEFHERFSEDTAGPKVEHVTLAQACNPFTDYPREAARSADYLMVATMSDDRVEVSYRYLRPIVSRYHGVWAGPRWGFGREEGIAPADMPLHYAQTRIALSPLVAFVQHYSAEVTHRVYAAAGCGAFQLTMPTAITGRYFRPDELVQATSPGEYTRLFDHYLQRPAERNAIAMAALRRAYGEHTCFHRVDKLVSHLEDWRRRGLF